MNQIPISQLPIADAGSASGEVEEIFGEIRWVMEIPFVPNLFQAVAGSAAVLRGTWELVRNIYLSTSLSKALATMILFSVSAASKCQYCKTVHLNNSRGLGVEETTLEALESNLSSLSP
ncbi:MAG: carboxymuconolactone decarboxylase family protein [Rhodospirillales bacterium]|jgi:AhpD family alkylhydroperoxidase|nr:carboxymuconolactone decarboxylase family protein [Rhodospirillales bacterium]